MSERNRFERVLAILIGLTAVIASLVAVLQVDWGRHSERASLLAARLPVQIFEGIAASSTRTTFHLRTQQDAVALGLEALDRQMTAVQFPDIRDAEQALGAAEQRASERLQAVATEMAAIDPADRGVDPRTLRALTAELTELAADTRRQNAEADRADLYSGRESKTVFALSLVAIAGALLALAAVLRKGAGGRISLGTGAFALTLALSCAIWSFF